MYADVIMQELKGDSTEEVPLPEPAGDKMMLDQLEVSCGSVNVCKHVSIRYTFSYRKMISLYGS